MKALSLWEPWATLIRIGVKTIETRSWSTRYRGPLAIHAAKRPAPAGQRIGEYLLVGDADLPKHASPFLVRWPEATALDPREPWWSLGPGMIVATCELVDVLPMIDIGDDFDGDRFLCLDGPRDKATMDAAAYTEADIFDRDACLRIAGDQLPYGDFRPGRYAWILDNVKTQQPTPAKGRQGLFEVASL